MPGIKTACYVQMDGDRYQLLLPSYDDAMAFAEQDIFTEDARIQDLFLGQNKNEPYLCKRIGKQTFSMLPSWRGPDAKGIYNFVHQNNQPLDKYTADQDTVFHIRPMLLPVDQSGKPIRSAIRDKTGTLVYGGSLYDKGGLPIYRDAYETAGIGDGPVIGDTFDCEDESSTLAWIVYHGALLARNTLFCGTVLQVWRAGIR